MAPSRTPELAPLAGEKVRSVTEFTREVKAALEASVRPGWVRGEVSNFRQQSSGHLYFSLKDAGAQVSAVMFRADASRQSVALKEGAQIVVFGEISLYEPRGSYQLVVRAIVDDGVGRLQREFEALKARLLAEGLFDADRKVAVPALPQTVGFITSPTGAAVQDFCRIMVRRGWRGRLVILPAKVQGEGAAEEMVSWLNFAAASGKFDLLVIGRGGGSIEDLWAFNEEALVRAVAACPLPIISAVGHEIDFTLCDFAADVRAETPSAAAELISSRFVAALQNLERDQRALMAATLAQIERQKVRVGNVGNRLRLLSPSARIERAFLRLDDLENRLRAAADRTLQKRKERWWRLAGRFDAVHPARKVELYSHHLLGLWKRLQSASPLSVLQRGYALVRDGEGRPITRAAHMQKPGAYLLEFGDGRVSVEKKT